MESVLDFKRSWVRQKFKAPYLVEVESGSNLFWANGLEAFSYSSKGAGTGDRLE